MKKPLLSFVLVFSLLVPTVAIVGCGTGNDVGETVQGPPRDLVEKSLPKNAKPQNTSSTTK